MTSLTQRTSGLVQRRTEAIRSAAADKERESGDEDDEARRGEEDDDDKGDSKETRLTLMEEVLLLGLKDREVWVDFNPTVGLVGNWNTVYVSKREASLTSFVQPILHVPTFIHMAT